MRNEPNFGGWPAVPRVPLYKRTQLPAGPGGTRPRGREGNVQNEPNFAEGTGWGLGDEGRTCKTKPISGVPPGPEDQMRKTKPNLGRMGHLGAGASARPIVRNEPNFGESRWDRTAKCAKQSQFPAGPGGTRPQGRGTQGDRAKRTQSFDCGSRIADWGQTCGGIPALRPATFGLRRPVCTNKPNSRSQSCKTKPISGGPAGTKGQMRKTKPNLGRMGRLGAGASGRPIVRNEPNFWWPGYTTIPVFYSTTPNRSLLCETNPICTSGEASVGQAATPNAVRCVWEPDPPYKWAQLRQTNPIQPGRQARSRRGGIVRNKANSAEAAGRASTL